MLNRLKLLRTSPRPPRGNGKFGIRLDHLTKDILELHGRFITFTSAQTTSSRRFFCGEILLLIGKISRLFRLLVGSVVIKSSPNVL